MHRFVALAPTFLVLALFAASLSGCADEGPPRYHVSGKITMGDKPIPSGMIFFEPQSSGVQGYAKITNSEYDTRKAGAGHSGGPMVARISGYDGVPANELPLGKPLFQEVQIKVELPEEDSTQDFDVTKGDFVPPSPLDATGRNLGP